MPINERKTEEPNETVLKTYLLKDIPEEIWNKFAIRARGERLNIKEAMFILVTQYANGDIELKMN